MPRLTNPGNDATLIATTLRSLGFTLVGGGAQENVDKAQFDHLVQDFGRAIQGADVALFYYAGHGMQVDGSNWLADGSNPTRPQDLEFQMVNAELVLKQMDGAGTRLNLVILDACRNNPFATLGTRAVATGLAQMHAPEGTMISFATQPGNVAADGSGADGPCYGACRGDASAGAGYFSRVQPGGPHREARYEQCTASLGFQLSDRWRVLFHPDRCDLRRPCGGGDRGRTSRADCEARRSSQCVGAEWRIAGQQCLAKREGRVSRCAFGNAGQTDHAAAVTVD